MNKSLRRSVVALATAFACLMVLSTPAGAVVVNATAAITSGNVRLQNGTSILDIPLSGTTGTGCGTTLAISFDINSTGTTGTVAVTALTSTGRFTVGTSHYVAVLSLVSTVTAGTITGSSGTTGTAMTGLVLRIGALLYNASNTSSTATDCGLGTQVCRYNNVTATFSGTYSGNIHDTVLASDTAALTSTASGALQGVPCNPPFSTYTGGTATVTAMGIHILTP